MDEADGKGKGEVAMGERTIEGKDRQQEGNDTAPLCTALLWVHKNRSYYILWAGNVQLLLLRLF